MRSILESTRAAVMRFSPVQRRLSSAMALTQALGLAQTSASALALTLALFGPASALAADLPTSTAARPGAVATPAPLTLHAFDAQSWAALQRQLPRPAIVVFTTTDCAHCPAVVEKIDQIRRGRQPQAMLVTVVMDIGPDDADQLESPHYRLADRVMAFDGEAVRLRYGVDPRWIGVTPYIALLPNGAAKPKFVMGAPTGADWAGLYGVGGR
jgi:hypothetical protein